VAERGQIAVKSTSSATELSRFPYMSSLNSRSKSIQSGLYLPQSSIRYVYLNGANDDGAEGTEGGSESQAFLQ